MTYLLIAFGLAALVVAGLAARAARRRARTRKAMGALLARSFHAAQSEGAENRARPDRPRTQPRRP